MIAGGVENGGIAYEFKLAQREMGVQPDDSPVFEWPYEFAYEVDWDAVEEAASSAKEAALFVAALPFMILGSGCSSSRPGQSPEAGPEADQPQDAAAPQPLPLPAAPALPAFPALLMTQGAFDAICYGIHQNQFKGVNGSVAVNCGEWRIESDGSAPIDWDQIEHLNGGVEDTSSTKIVAVMQMFASPMGLGSLAPADIRRDLIMAATPFGDAIRLASSNSELQGGISQALTSFLSKGEMCYVDETAVDQDQDLFNRLRSIGAEDLSTPWLAALYEADGKTLKAELLEKRSWMAPLLVAGAITEQLFAANGSSTDKAGAISTAQNAYALAQHLCGQCVPNIYILNSDGSLKRNAQGKPELNSAIASEIKKLKPSEIIYAEPATRVAWELLRLGNTRGGTTERPDGPGELVRCPMCDEEGDENK